MSSPPQEWAVRPPDDASARRTVEAVWRREAPRIIAALTRTVGDFSLAEDLAQEALAGALAQWPAEGVPRNPAAWLTRVAQRRAIDHWRREGRYRERLTAIAPELEHSRAAETQTPDGDPDGVDDDVLRLIFIACHPVLSREASVALTLRTVGGLTSEQIGHAFLVPTSTVQQRIVRAKRTLAAARVPFALPEIDEFGERLSAVLAVLYLMFTEAHAPSVGDDVINSDLAREALRIARVLVGTVPREPEVHALVALMALTAARFPARVRSDGAPVRLDEQDRSRWDRTLIRLGQRELGRAESLGRARGPYALQAAIALCHAVAPSVDDTDWPEIVVCYAALARVSPSPAIELNHAVAMSMAGSPADALELVDRMATAGTLRGRHEIPSVRAELLARLGRTEEARVAFAEAASLVNNGGQRTLLQGKSAALTD